MPVKSELEEKLKKLVLDTVKELAQERLPPAIPDALVDGALKEVEELLEDVQIFK